MEPIARDPLNDFFAQFMAITLGTFLGTLLTASIVYHLGKEIVLDELRAITPLLVQPRK